MATLGTTGSRRMKAARGVNPVCGPEPCDVCGGDRFDLIGRLDRHGKPLQTGMCLRCGLVRHLRVPSESELAEFYASRYRREYHNEAAPSPRRVMRAWKNGGRIYRQLRPLAPPGAEVFEIGAGIGCTVKQFELAGHPASGIDPGEDFLRYAVQTLGAQLECKDLFELPETPRCDVALLVHVIEHFRSPRRALEKIHTLLRPGGQLYVECPNLLAPFARPGKMFHYAHVHNFTPSSLRMLAEACGYEVERELSAEDDPNLQVLFRKAETPRLAIDRDNRRRTLEALGRYGAASYHLRGRYLLRRAAKLGGYAWEHATAGRFVRRIAARIAARRRTDGSGDPANVP